jgi:hypothetical protein
MNTRFALITALGTLCFGCATPEQPQPAATGARAAPTNVANTAPMPTRSRPALTGSRLAPLDSDDLGTNSVSAATGDDYRHNDATRVRVLNGDPRGM